MCGFCGCSSPEKEEKKEDEGRILSIEQDVMSYNQKFADENRHHFLHHDVFALNLMSSPGSGKTTLLVKLIEMLKSRIKVGVLEGDQATSLDADRIKFTGVPVLQINTGQGCHLDAEMVGKAFNVLPLGEDAVLFIENVGNLVCPAAFDLGEAFKIAILSVTEGEDKPLKYPDMFAACRVLLVNKIDLLPHVSFDVKKCLEYAKRINPDLVCFEVSATTGQGMDGFSDWLLQEKAAFSKAAHEHPLGQHPHS